MTWTRFLFNKVFIVDGNNTNNAYDTLSNAYTAANSELPSGEIAVFLLAPGQTHTGNVTLNNSRDVVIASLGSKDGSNTVYSGNLTLTAAASARRLVIENIKKTGSDTVNDLWYVTFNDCQCENAITVNHGSGGDNAKVIFDNCKTDDMTLVENTAADSGTAITSFLNCDITNSLSSTAIDLGNYADLSFTNCTIDVTNSSGSSIFVDMNDASSGAVAFENTTIKATVSATSLHILDNLTNVTINWDGAEITTASGDTVDLTGGEGTHAGAPVLAGDTEPTDPPTDTVWRDIAYNEVLTYNDSNWTLGGGLIREVADATTAIAVAEINTTITIPSDAMVVSTSIKITDAFTAGGGATQVGLGTGSAGDPDKYCETATLGLNESDENIYSTYNSGGGDALWVTAETAPETAGGTIDDGTARVVVYYREPRSL